MGKEPVDQKNAVFEDIERIMNELPLSKEQVENILHVRFGVPDASSTRYFRVFKSSSPRYTSIEARLSKSDDHRGMIILKLKAHIPFTAFESIYGNDYSIMACAPEDPDSATYWYDMKCKLSFGIRGKMVTSIVMNWIR